MSSFFCQTHPLAALLPSGLLKGMEPLAVLGFCLFLVGCCPEIPALNLPTPADLPDAIHFRTRKETFNQNYFLALRDGRIWYKNKETPKGGWKLLGKTGLPEGCGLIRFPSPDKLVSISGDGIHLMALSEKGSFYRGTNLRNSIEGGLEWTDKWGWPMADGPGLKAPFGEKTLWDVSDAHTFDLKYYEDGNQTRHHIGLGVAHMYLLGEDQTSIFFNDWWLPADWSREMCGPWRGTYKATSLSASGSTIFLINDGGTMYTKMYDFDVSGENPFLTYTFVDENPASNVRRLPMPEWRLQPPVGMGKITKTISITQTGEGNAARELRVEGEKDGKTGYFTKAIFADTWSFQETSAPLQAPFLTTLAEEPPADPKNPEDRVFSGKLTKEGIAEALSIELLNFHIVCSPTYARFFHKGKPIQAKGKALLFPFHHVHTLVTHQREMKYWKKAVEKAQIRAALVVPSSLQEVEDADAKRLLSDFFRDLRVVNLSGEASETDLTMAELTVWDMFRAPDNEKGGTSRFALRLTKP